MRLFLIRHGQTEWNVLGKSQGHSDVPLDSIGQMQSLRLADRFQGESLTKVYSSDLVRCLETARPLAAACGAELVATDHLRERSFGEWEGWDYSAIRAAQQASGLDPFSFRSPGGESMHDVWARMAPFICSLDKLEGDCAVVSHGGTCSVVLAQLLRASIETTRSFRFWNTAVTELKLRHDGCFELVSYCDTSHLHSSGAPMIDVHSASKN